MKCAVGLACVLKAEVVGGDGDPSVACEDGCQEARGNVIGGAASRAETGGAVEHEHDGDVGAFGSVVGVGDERGGLHKHAAVLRRVDERLGADVVLRHARQHHVLALSERLKRGSGVRGARTT